MYLSTLGASAMLMVFRGPAAVVALLAVQIVYKVVTPVATGGFSNPVVISNLAIAVFHAATLWTIRQSIGNPFRG